MYRNCKWPPTWRHPCLSCFTCMCMLVYACMCAWDIPYTSIPDSTPIYPSATPQGGTPGIGQNSITLELIKIFEFCLKIWNLWRIPHPWVDAWFGGWVDGWGAWWWDQVKSLKFNKCWPNQDNSILFEDLWFVETPPPMGGWLDGSVGQWVVSGQMTKNLINLDLIKMIQLCLKIYDL